MSSTIAKKDEKKLEAQRALAKVFKAAMEDAHLDAAVLHDRTGVSTSTIHKWMQGRMEPGAIEFSKCLRVLDVWARPVFEHLWGRPIPPLAIESVAVPVKSHDERSAIVRTRKG